MNSRDAWEAVKQSWSPNPPVDDVADFDPVEEALGQPLPADYKGFLMESNGGETLKPLAYVSFYRLHDLIRRLVDQPSAALEIAASRNERYAFDLMVNRDSACYPVVSYPLGEQGRTHARRVARNFGDFLATIASGEQPQWRARIELPSATAGGRALHPCDQPEEAFGVRSMWEAIKNSWYGDHPIVDTSEFDRVEKVLGQVLPLDYKWFLMQSNGGETLEPLEHVTLYGLQELLPRRADGQPPDLLEIATDDSDGFAFDLTVRRVTVNYPVVRYSLGEQDRKEIERVSRSFAEFLAIIAAGEAP